MLDFMKNHSQFAAGRFVAADGAKVKARLLQQMSDELNAVGGGCTKSGDKWFKVSVCVFNGEDFRINCFIPFYHGCLLCLVLARLEV